MEIRSISKKTKKPVSESEVKSDPRKNFKEKTLLENLQNFSNFSQKESQQWLGILTGIFLALLLGNPALGALATVLAIGKINLYNQQIREETQILAKTGLDPQWLELEISEKSLLTNIASVSSTLG